MDSPLLEFDFTKQGFFSPRSMKKMCHAPHQRSKRIKTSFVMANISTISILEFFLMIDLKR
jgi:hypothetical protein